MELSQRPSVQSRLCDKAGFGSKIIFTKWQAHKQRVAQRSAHRLCSKSAKEARQRRTQVFTKGQTASKAAESAIEQVLNEKLQLGIGQGSSNELNAGVVRMPVEARSCTALELTKTWACI
jgi:hypothetical protein